MSQLMRPFRENYLTTFVRKCRVSPHLIILKTKTEIVCFNTVLKSEAEKNNTFNCNKGKSILLICLF